MSIVSVLLLIHTEIGHGLEIWIFSTYKYNTANFIGDENLDKSKLNKDLYSFDAGQQDDKLPTNKLDADEKLLSGVPLAI